MLVEREGGRRKLTKACAYGICSIFQENSFNTTKKGVAIYLDPFLRNSESDSHGSHRQRFQLLKLWGPSWPWGEEAAGKAKNDISVTMQTEGQFEAAGDGHEACPTAGVWGGAVFKEIRQWIGWFFAVHRERQ